MSRPRRDPDEVRVEKFKKAVAHSQVDAGLPRLKNLADATGIPYSTLWKRLDQPDNLTVGQLRSIISTTSLDPAAVLELVGYSRKEALRVLEHYA